jgi:hypothetical protein
VTNTVVTSISSWRRRRGERTREGHALALTARELRRHAPAQALELDEPEELVDARVDLGLGPLADAQREGDVLEHVEVAEQGVVLEHQADVALARRAVEQVLAVVQHASGIRTLEAGQDPQERGLARARRAEQRDQPARRDLDRDVVDGGEVAEALGDVLDGDGHGATPPGTDA